MLRKEGKVSRLLIGLLLLSTNVYANGHPKEGKVRSSATFIISQKVVSGASIDASQQNLQIDTKVVYIVIEDNGKKNVVLQ
jgi:hypothetical protein